MVGFDCLRLEQCIELVIILQWRSSDERLSL